jgi:hypothetical protein
LRKSNEISLSAGDDVVNDVGVDVNDEDSNEDDVDNAVDVDDDTSNDGDIVGVEVDVDSGRSGSEDIVESIPDCSIVIKEKRV